jgi:acyl-coenzyme A thioesterase PaaI-like protein
MNDAALFAASSVVPKEMMLSTGFHIEFTGTISDGELIARGRVIGTSDEHCLAETVVVDGEGKELGRGTGTFVKSEIPFSPEMGYE